MDQKEAQKMAQFLGTEHFTLQGARSAVVSDANVRFGAYLTTVSAGVIALAFVSQVSGLGEVFLLFSFVLFPILLYVGISTVVLLISLYGADALYTQAINRIRHFYVQAAPGIEEYLSFPHYDDNRSIDRARALFIGYRLGILVSPLGQVMLINSFLAAIFASILAAGITGGQLAISAGVGTIGFFVSLLIHFRLAIRVNNRSREFADQVILPLLAFPISYIPAVMALLVLGLRGSSEERRAFRRPAYIHLTELQSPPQRISYQIWYN